MSRFQKVSLYSWAGGSVCTAANEAYELLQISKIKPKGETDSEWVARRAKTVDEVNTRLLTLFHSCVQVRGCPRYLDLRLQTEGRGPAGLPPLTLLVLSWAG